MKHLGKMAFGACALILSACSSEEPNIGNNSNAADRNVYATLNLRLPVANGSRANNGTEFGQDFENNVGRILVVLATKSASGEYRFLTSAQSDPMSGSQSGANVKYTLNFSADDLNPNPLDKEEPGVTIPGQTVYVFAYCNPTPDILTRIANKSTGEAFTDEIGTISDKDNAHIWTPNKFLMTNCEIPAPRQIDSHADLVSKYNTPEKAFDLGTVKVKRAAARFDFELGGDNADNVYDIKDFNGTSRVGSVELTDMALFNIAKSYHYLPRTNSSWSWLGDTELCGDLEGFVMSFNKNNFKGQASLNNYRPYYYCNLIGNTLDSGSAPSDDELTWTSIRPDDWNGRTADDHNTWSPSDGTDYRIWRYTSENTIPSTSNGSAATQKIGITTGVVFRGVFTPENTEVWNGNTVYVHDNIVYGDFLRLKEYVEKNPETLVAADFKKVSAFTKQMAGATGGRNNLLQGVSPADRAGFSAYAPNEDGDYIMYYYYYNRHKSNGNNSLMGQDEFGVVRNNVYKLKVTKIGTLGKPESPNNPDTPDEEENAYFSVSCIVMPWTVRVNNIEF